MLGKKIAISICLWAMALSLIGCVRWKPFNSAEGKFSVVFPGSPKKESIRAYKGLKPFVVHVVKRSNNHEFRVGYSTLPKDFALMNPTETTLANQGKWIKQEMQVNNRKSITLGDVSGFRVQGTRGTAPRSAKARMFVTEKHVYYVAYYYPEGNEDKKSAKKFFDSFKINN